VTEWMLVDDPDGYRAAVAALAAGEGPVGVDAERASGFRYFPRAYLVQMYRRGSGTFLFDPVPLGSLAELGAALADTEWIFHAASQDLACVRELGLEPPRLFDTELGARLLGLPRVGLAAVAEELLGVSLAKEHSAADWSTRPLPEPWLEYAAQDVDLLPDLRDAMARLFAEAGKERIAAEEFAEVLHRPEKSAAEEPWRRLSGIHGVRGARNLAVARELWQARDELARELDRSPGRLIPDAAIVAVAKAMPGSRGALSALKEFTGRASRSELSRWWEAVERGRTTDALPSPSPRGTGALPPPRAWAERNPDAAARLRVARERIAALAEESSMPVENLLTPEILRRLAWEPPQPVTAEAVDAALAEAGARPWQREAAAALIAQAFVDALQAPDTPGAEPSSE